MNVERLGVKRWELRVESCKLWVFSQLQSNQTSVDKKKNEKEKILKPSFWKIIIIIIKGIRLYTIIGKLYFMFGLKVGIAAYRTSSTCPALSLVWCNLFNWYVKSILF